MKLIRFALAMAVLVSVGGLAYVAQQIEGAGASQVAAAQEFLALLTPDQKQLATFAFDDKERFNWNFVPLQTNDRKSTRKGLPLESMSAEQKKKAMDLLRSGTSESGAQTAQLIMSLEGILRDVEKGGAMVRNPDWYFVTVFGTPSKTGNWGWRIEGHHLSINFTLDGTQVTAASPFFFGANPAVIKFGPKEGTRVLGAAQDLGTKLFASLSDEQKAAAVQTKSFGEPGQKEVSPKVGAPVGLPAANMTAEQKAILVQLLEAYASRMPKDVGERELKAVRDAGLDKVYFAYSGKIEEGKERTYRVQGPTFVVEFLNIQADGQGNPNNHIHSAWRRIKGDFGLN
jgi:hypothetical protein